MWDEWREIYLDEGQAKANAYFRKNRKAMTGKMRVSWQDRYERGKDVSAIDAAMHDWYKLGEDVFARGQQNIPLKKTVTMLNISPKDIEARVDPDRQIGHIPDWVRHVVATSDINPSYAITTVIVGFGADQRAAVLWYGTHAMQVPREMPDAQKKAAIMLELQKHEAELFDLPCKPQSWMIDGGGSPHETVQTFSFESQRRRGIPVICAFGRAWKGYRPRREDRRFEQSFVRSETRQKQWCIWNVDYWKEIMQKGWLGATGAPGAIDLYAGRHSDFAQQVCNETLAGKVELNGMWIYDWKTRVGQPHDYGDCMAMAFAMAGMQGIGTGGASRVKTAAEKIHAGGLREEVING
jgi:hypothetical protein